MAKPEKEQLPIWLSYTVSVLFGLAFSITIFFVIWNNSLNSKKQEFLIDTVSIRESVMRNIVSAEDSLENLSALITTTSSLDSEVFREFAKQLTDRNDFILAAACIEDQVDGPNDNIRTLAILGKYECPGFSLEEELARTGEENFSNAIANIFETNKIAVLSTRKFNSPGRYIWLIKPVVLPDASDQETKTIISLVIDSSRLLTNTHLSSRISTAVYSESTGLTGRQLLVRNDANTTADGWQISTFDDQSYSQLPHFSVRFDFSKQVFWEEIEQGLIFTAILIGAGVTLLLVALVRARDMQARELRHRNIVIERKVEEQTKELAIARDKALEASRMKSDFLASMSHEIRTPLNAIIGMSELLSETKLNDEQKKYINIFRKAGDTLLSLVNDILDLSKIEARQLVLEEISFDLRETVEESVDIYAVKAAEKGVELAARVMPGIQTRRIGDPTRLRQIILNLISNALKFTEQGEIIVTVRPDESNDDKNLLQIDVSDTGIGIPASKLEQIFASFTQVDSSTSRKYGGTGLGLTISRSLTQMMGGRIWVESEEGKGSTFCLIVRLPVDTRAPERSGRHQIERDLNGKRILVVDDNSTNRLILRENLAALGAEVVEADNGYQALKLIEQSLQDKVAYDLGLIDCRMPAMDGFQLAEAMREKGIDLTRILMISSADLGRDMEKAKTLSLGAYLVKPVKRADLLQVINRKLFDQDTGGESESGSEPMDEDELPQTGTILLVEDNPDNRLLIKAYLKKTEYTIVEAENGQEAVDKFREQDFDLIFMDVQMPIMDGHEATRQIRALESEKNRRRTPIIALTAHAIREEIDKCIAAGCDTHVGKPVKKATLLQTIEQYIL
jgi:signal transduction histidine kinase/DNA-binding response OmpR family regulator